MEFPYDILHRTQPVTIVSCPYPHRGSYRLNLQQHQYYTVCRPIQEPMCNIPVTIRMPHMYPPPTHPNYPLLGFNRLVLSPFWKYIVHQYQGL